jgi:NAD-dependent dihydropyrimidine dehydrogenase PreA subunit
VKRKIVQIDEAKCDGCGLCIPRCREGALKIVNGKARLVSDVVCDGVGACLGKCPKDAITIIEREAAAFDEAAVEKKAAGAVGADAAGKAPERSLKNWPLQLSLIPAGAPYLEDADLLIAADCVAFSFPDFHKSLLKDKILIIACPKLDDAEFYMKKLTELFKAYTIKSLTIAHMEVPCCFGLKRLLEGALAGAGKNIPLEEIVISMKGVLR